MSTIYEVLHRPIVTEKSNYLVNQLHQYVFEVTNDANRTLVKDAVETLFQSNSCTGEYHQCPCQTVSTAAAAV